VKEFPALCVAIVGGEGQANFSQLRSRIAACGLERNFELVPRIPRSTIPDVFYDFDLSVSTHRNEGFGIVHIESLAAGTPVVAYRAGGLVEILEKGGSTLVDGGVAEFAQAVGQLLRNPEERVRLAEEGRRVAESGFSIEAMGRKHFEYYRAIVEEKRT
jgi:glycosyltransferase involved in cell wall biosynthesis